MFGRKIKILSMLAKSTGKVTAMLVHLALLLFAASFLAGLSLAAESGMPDLGSATSGMRAAEKDFQQAEEDFAKLSKGSSGQKTGTHSFSDTSARNSASTPSVTPRSMSDPVNPALHGSPETGYAGTWTDPATGDIITSVIAPTPRQNDNYQNYPIIIEPDVSNWNSSGYNRGVYWDGNNPQWPTTPDNPGWGGNPGFSPTPPPPPSSMGPGMGMGMPGQNFYPSPQLPPNFHPGYRPLYPNPGGRPPVGNGPNWSPGNKPGWNQGAGPGWNPGWNQGNNPGLNPGGNPAWNQGWNPGNQPGFNPGFNPGWNQGNNPGVNPGWNQGNRPGWNPGGGSWGGNPPGGNQWGGRPWRGNQ